MDEVPVIASKSHLQKMINNRDYSVLINYSPPVQCLNTEHSNQIFSHDLRLLEIRAVLLSCIYYSAHIVKQFNAQDINSVSSKINGLSSENELPKLEYLDQLDLHLKSLKKLYEQLESDPPIPVPKNVFGSFFRSKLFSLEKSKIMLTIIINFIELIQIMGSTMRNSNCTDDNRADKMKVITSELTSRFEETIDYCQGIISKTIVEEDSSLKLEGRKEVLEVLTNMIDVSMTINIYKY